MTRARSRPLDLLTPVVPPERWHPNYRRIVEGASLEERAVLARWAEGFVDRDGKLAIEFQTSFNSVFWELYVYASLRELGAEVDLSHARPDFVATGRLGDLVAEAVVASHPDRYLPEWAVDLSEDPTPRGDLLDLAVLRLTQAVVSKHRKWVEEYAALPHCKDKPFVICVAPFDQPLTSRQGTEAIDRVLFGGRRPLLREDDAGENREVGVTETDGVYKASGAKVSVGLFRDEKFCDVSAVLFSSLATWSKVRAMADVGGASSLMFPTVRFSPGVGPVQVFQQGSTYEETLLDGCHLFLNPLARYGLDARAWRERGVGVHYFGVDGTVSDVPAGMLVSRIAVEAKPMDEGDVWTQPHEMPPDGVRHTRAVPPDGVLFGGNSQVFFADSIVRLLHRGWTITVSRDAIDGDWCGIAKPGVHLELEEFIAANGDAAAMTSFHTERDAAIDEAKRLVDAAHAKQGST